MDKAAVSELLHSIHALMPRAMLRQEAHARLKLIELRERSGRGLGQAALVHQLRSLEAQLAASVREREARQGRRPALSFPRELPITDKKNEIVRAIRDHRVVIVSGETGCGKSTQIPKMCLEAGRGMAGIIACTQPRRIAAITIAHRIAEELGESLGRSVGYKIRFQDRTPRQAYIKVLTDGMLLAETQSDRRLYDYDTLIIDEAHERSLNIDFLLGLSRTLLAVRPELRVIITSATLDTEKFSQAFGRAPVIKVGGRMYPVEVEYLPARSFSAKPDEADYVDMAVMALGHVKAKLPPGDILVFMPTEQDILETCSRLEGKKYPGVTVLPLYARLPAAQQGRVYAVQGPKIVVATNVAETSLTIPGIRYVVDTGLARISQYQPGSRINSLPISPISRSSADQRLGRCGRVEAGHGIRLYEKDDYESRPRFTPPEILRSNLAEVILRMMDLDLGHPSDFPFVDPPHPRAVKDGYETLAEIGAITGQGRTWDLTPLGRRMARIPLDPRLSRLLIEADEQGCLAEAAVIAAALSIRDPRERPPESAEQADLSQAVFKHPDSDFLTLLNIWTRFHGDGGGRPGAARLRAFCKEHFLSFSRMREWTYVFDQIVSILEEQILSFKPRGTKDASHGPPALSGAEEIPANLYDAVHKSILSGFLSNFAAHKEKRVYTAPKGREVTVFPGSVLFGRSAAWIVAAEVVRTSRLFARTVARVEPAWLEEVGREHCRYSYDEPRWDKDLGEVRAAERVTLFGLEIISGREVSYGRINPDEAHRIFIRSALVEGHVKNPPEFLKHNLELEKRLAQAEAKLRRRDILVGPDGLAEFYGRRLPGVYDWRGLEQRIRKAGGEDFLRMGEQDILRAAPDEEELARFPDELVLGDRRLKLSYRFAPGEEDDGVTIKLPAGLARNAPAEPLEWGVPGLVREKITALLKGLPMKFRRALVPVAGKVDIIMRDMDIRDPSLFKNLSRFVRERFRVDIPVAVWGRVDIPEHLRMRIAVTGHDGQVLAAGRDIGELRTVGPDASALEESRSWRAAQERWERQGLTTWDFEALPKSVPVGDSAEAYPAFEPAERGVNIRLFAGLEEALATQERGVEALLLLKFGKELDHLKGYLLLPEEHETAALFFGGRAALVRDMLDLLRGEVLRRNLRSRPELEDYAKTVVRLLYEKGEALRRLVIEVLDKHRSVRQLIQSAEQSAKSRPRVREACSVVRHELERLVTARFLQSVSLERLAHFPRYLEALRIRVERAKNDPEKDRSKSSQAEPFVQALQELREEERAAESPAERRRAVEEFHWMVEEFRVALFAPELKTAFPVSAKRLAAKLKEIEAIR